MSGRITPPLLHTPYLSSQSEINQRFKRQPWYSNYNCEIDSYDTSHMRKKYWQKAVIIIGQFSRDQCWNDETSESAAINLSCLLIILHVHDARAQLLSAEYEDYDIETIHISGPKFRVMLAQDPSSPVAWSWVVCSLLGWVCPDFLLPSLIDQEVLSLTALIPGKLNSASRLQYANFNPTIR